MVAGESTDDFDFPCAEAKWLMGFLINQGSSSPKKTVSKKFCGGKMALAIERDKQRIEENLHKIRHCHSFI